MFMHLSPVFYIDNMADDSTPSPFPNLKVPQWHYQISNVPRLKDQANSSFWKAVEDDGALFSIRRQADR